nr:DUF3289 family protein [Coprobacter tertius]
MLILQGKRRKGMNRSNSETAADLLYGDYTMDESGFNKLKQQLISIFVSEKKKKQEDAEKYADQRINKVRSFARKSDDNLFKIFNNEIEWYSMGKLEDVAHKMVAKMKANKGGEFSDAVLTGKVKEHDSSKSFINHVKKAIIEYLSKNKGRFENLNITDGSTGVLYQYLLDHGVQTPTFNDKISGLGITIHDVWAYQVFITDYAINGNNFTAKLEFIYWDHFGLDYPDIVNYDNDIFYSWFVLQHFKNYQPFITKIIINETCNGTF